MEDIMKRYFRSIYGHGIPRSLLLILFLLGPFALRPKATTQKPTDIQTTYMSWSESFEDVNRVDRWNKSAGVWQVGTPSYGPTTVHGGVQCAGTSLSTGTYPGNVNSQLERVKPFIVQAANQNPRLQFWHWFSMAGAGNCGAYCWEDPDYGVVQIKTASGTWQPISVTYQYDGGGWTHTSIDLRPFADSVVQIGFLFVSNGGAFTAAGWYVDDVTLISEFTPTIECHIVAGWNMISIPVIPVICRKDSLFPHSGSQAFAYEGSYITRDTLMSGIGYWLKFSAADTMRFHGLGILCDSVPVTQGWNMIGSISVPVPVSTIITDSAGVVFSDFFGYKGSYLKVDTIQPGFGYWIKVNKICNLVLSSTAGDAALGKNRITIVPISEQPPLSPDGAVKVAANALPTEYVLGPSYPNPFNPSTTITYQLPEPSSVRLTIYCSGGRNH